LRKLFLVGCPRSGTTWLQIVLASHPEIVTVRETHLFDTYMAHVYRLRESETNAAQTDGISRILPGAAFDDAVRAFCDHVFAAIAARRPEAAVLLEKTPANVLHHRVIRRLYPDALFLHLVRDPRAVAASMLAANREAWGKWAPANVFHAAQTWYQYVHAGYRELSAYGKSVLQLRYEDALQAPDAALARICGWLGIAPLTYDPARFSVDALRAKAAAGNPVDPGTETRANFFRRGSVDGWRLDLTADQVAVIEGMCAGLMEEAGYTPELVGRLRR
jgi:hypothetical protein